MVLKITLVHGTKDLRSYCSTEMVQSGALCHWIPRIFHGYHFELSQYSILLSAFKTFSSLGFLDTICCWFSSYLSAPTPTFPFQSSFLTHLFNIQVVRVSFVEFITIIILAVPCICCSTWTLHCCLWAFSSCGEEGLLSSWGARASLVAQAIGWEGSVVAACRLSFLMSCGILICGPGI